MVSLKRAHLRRLTDCDPAFVRSVYLTGHYIASRISDACGIGPGPGWVWGWVSAGTVAGRRSKSQSVRSPPPSASSLAAGWAR